jgi:hypothetical protein
MGLTTQQGGREGAGAGLGILGSLSRESCAFRAVVRRQGCIKFSPVYQPMFHLYQEKSNRAQA